MINRSAPEPLFTIITVTLNAGNLLFLTIQSILRQQFPDFEIVVKDGGSTDRSLETLPDDPRIRLLQSKDNGIYDAMNQALEIAAGKYILFLNAGDTFASNGSLERVAGVIKTTDASLVYTDYYKGASEILIRSPRNLSGRFLIRTMLCHQACYFKRACFEKSGNFDLKYRVAADYEFLVRTIYTYKSTYSYLPFPTTKYLGGGHSFKNMQIAWKEVRDIRKKHFHPIRLFMFYSWYNLTFPALRLKMIETYNPTFYYRFTNFLKSGKTKL
jgi:glycosyltransferase involved in cell wall biosynthesis